MSAFEKRLQTALEKERHDVTHETLLPAADAHSIAGKLMVGLIEKDAITEAAKQLERTARKLRKLCDE